MPPRWGHNKRDCRLRQRDKRRGVCYADAARESVDCCNQLGLLHPVCESRQSRQVARLLYENLLIADRVSGKVMRSVVSVCFIIIIITARCYASAVLAMGLCPSVCPSVTSRCSTKTAKRRITQTTPHDTPKTLVF